MPILQQKVCKSTITHRTPGKVAHVSNWFPQAHCRSSCANVRTHVCMCIFFETHSLKLLCHETLYAHSLQKMWMIHTIKYGTKKSKNLKHIMQRVLDPVLWRIMKNILIWNFHCPKWIWLPYRTLQARPCHFIQILT